MACTCSPTTRCPAAWELRDAFHGERLRGLRSGPDAFKRRQQLAQQYTEHIRAAGELAQSPLGTEAWPMWLDDDHPDPRGPRATAEA